MLKEVAITLSSKEMQLFKAKHFDIIPTFDVTKRDSDPDIDSYCQEHSEICDFIENIKPINMREILTDHYGPQYFETELLLPNSIRNFLLDKDIEKMKFTFRSNFLMCTEYMKPYDILSIIITAISALIGFFVLFLIYRLRENPYIKVISPRFCGMIIFGCIMHIFKIICRLPPYYRLKPKLYVLYGTISTNFLYVPMLAVTFRIYRIFNSKRIVSKYLTNKYLTLFCSILMSLCIIYRIIILYNDDYFYIIITDITENRFPQTFDDLFDLDMTIYETYLYIIFISLLVLIIATGSKSKHFGDICYVFVIFFLNVEDFITEVTLYNIRSEPFPRDYFIITIINCLTCLFCIHMLVGSRLLYVIQNPSVFRKNGKYVTANLQEFIPMKKNEIKFFNIYKGFKQALSKGNNDSTVVNSNLSRSNA
eukprot:jgi/Orpsp1_1/1190431/evm.model.d7180000078936.1